MSLLVIVIYCDPYSKKKEKQGERKKNKGIEKDPNPPYSNQRICEKISLFYPYLTIQKEGTFFSSSSIFAPHLSFGWPSNPQLGSIQITTRILPASQHPN